MESADLSDCHYADACGGLKPRLAPDACVSGVTEQERGVVHGPQRTIHKGHLMIPY